MAWRDKNGVRWNARRDNGWPTDSKAPDSYTVAGWRKIDQKGRIRFGGSYWTHEKMKENPGRVVRVDWGGRPGNWTEEVAVVHFGHPEATPENLMDHHGSFFDHRNAVYAESCGDWNKRPVTRF